MDFHQNIDFNFNPTEFFDNLCISSPDQSESESSQINDGLPAKYRTQINARERNRTKSVNLAFETLRDLIPTEPKNRRLSKIEILRLANSYIQHLKAVIHQGNSHQPCFNHVLEQNCMKTRSTICTFCVNSRRCEPT